MNYQNLLVEIGVEELPGSILPVILEQFTKTFISHLEKEFISISEYKGFITPRRIALVIYNFPLEIEAKTTIKKGPLVKSAFDINKNPSPALLGFIKSLNESLDNLKIQELEKGDFVYFEQKTSPLITEKMLPKIVSETLTHMHLPKRMFWGENAFSFVRPIQWITLLLEKKPILSEIYNIKTKGESFGHRFHHPYALSFPDPSEYESVLETEGYVIPDFDKRLRFIKEEMKRGALEKDFVVNENAKLLNEVTGLVEWPFILMGHFDEAFLELPPQVLITTLEHHQRCFTLKDKTSSKLVPYFIIIANIESKNPNSVIFHNEKVIHARLSDASFHYKQDLKTPLLNHIPNLKKVIFQQGLGSLYDKSLRISFLAEQIMALLAIEHSDIQKAALLIKADLLTNMVSEFPELQGSMGKYYALHEGYSLEIAESIEEHYLPLHAEGNLPVTNLGKILSICDKVDLLVGMFGLGKAPKSDKDPFGLRRAALGIMRILIESEYDIDLKSILQLSITSFGDKLKNKDIISEVNQFCFERLKAYYHEKAISINILQALSNDNQSNPYDFFKKMNALQYFLTLPEANALSSSFKRVQNILSKTKLNELPKQIDTSLLNLEEEKSLNYVLNLTEKKIKPLTNEKKYKEILMILSELKNPIDEFFDSVMVNVDNFPLRLNRLKLLANIQELFLIITDISFL